METKVRYVIVGLFVLVLSAALVGGVLWLSSGKDFGKTYDIYVAYMTESVSGLNLHAPVKYRGVDVGQVRDISLDPQRSEEVRLEFALERGTPVKTDTVAELKVQGLTGIAYIELSGGSRDAPVLKPSKGGKPPVIKTGPSLLLRLDTGLSTLLTNLNKTTETLNLALDEENRRSLKQILADTATLTHTLAARKGDIDAGLKSTARTMENAERATAELPKLMARIDQSVSALGKVAEDASRTSKAIGETVEGIGPDAQRFTHQTLPELQSLIVDLRETAANLRRLSEQVEQNPAVLLRGKQAPAPGPGE